MSQLPQASRDPGLDGIVPFRFACHRCGNCCSGGSGLVRLEPGETSALARALGMSDAAFVEQCVRHVVDPRSGTSTLALREDPSGGDAGGRCVLLEGANICRAYDARPAQCREFPYWPRVLADETAFEVARATCPGIAVEASSELRERAFALLEELYDDVDAFLAAGRRASTRECCLAGPRAGELLATALEADYAAACSAHTPIEPADAACPLERGRPLGCRVARADRGRDSSARFSPESAADFARAHDSAVIEGFYRRLRAIERELGYPSAYARLGELLRARGVRFDETEARA